MTEPRPSRTIDKWIIPMSMATFIAYSGFMLMVGGSYISQAKDYEYTSKTVNDLKEDVEKLKKSKSDLQENISIINTKIGSIEYNQRLMNEKLDRLLESSAQKKKSAESD